MEFTVETWALVIHWETGHTLVSLHSKVMWIPLKTYFPHNSMIHLVFTMPTITMCFQFSMLNIYHPYGCHVKGRVEPLCDKPLWCLEAAGCSTGSIPHRSQKMVLLCSLREALQSTRQVLELASNLHQHFSLVHLYVFALALRDNPQKNFDSEFIVMNARVFLGFQDASWLLEPNSTISTFVILSL